MAKSVTDTLLEMFGDPGAAAVQADLAQAATLSRQELSFRQRAGAAAARLRRAETPEDAAAAQADLAQRQARLAAAQRQAKVANIKRPVPQKGIAQIFGRARGAIENPPLTLAAIDDKGIVVAQADATANGAFHLTSPVAFENVVLQVSDAAQCVFYRSPTPISMDAGTVQYLDISLDAPEPKPSPVPTIPTMPDLVGQSEGVAKTLLTCLAVTDVTLTDKTQDGPADLVIAQTPKAGTAIKGDTAVTLTIRRASSTQPVLLPDITGTPLSQAEKTLKALGLRSTVAAMADDGPADRVLDQSPGAGTDIAGIDSVTLTVSARPQAPADPVTVPALIGKSPDFAKEVLTALDLGMQVAQTQTAEKAAGIIDQTPKSGTAVGRKSTVALLVNTPPLVEPAKVVVPNLVGRTAAQAAAVLKALGLAGTTQTVTDSGQKGTVVKQDPQPDTRVDTGSTMALFISDGGGRDDTPKTDFSRLEGLIAADPRSAARGVDLVTRLRNADVTDVDGIKTLAGLTSAKLRDRLRLDDVPMATSVRAILRKAVKDHSG